MDELESTLAAIRKCADRPDFQKFLRERWMNQRIYGNTAKIYGNTTPIYDPLAEAVRILHKERPEIFQDVSDIVKQAQDKKLADARWNAKIDKAKDALQFLALVCPEEWREPLVMIGLLLIFLKRDP